jgi:hypothetical protein
MVNKEKGLSATFGGSEDETSEQQGKFRKE